MSCGEVCLAAEQAGIARASHYNWLRDDPEYRQQFEEADEIAMSRLLGEVRRRAVDGVEEPIIYQGALCYATGKDGKPSTKPLTTTKYSDNLLMFLVKGKRPEYRDSWKGELSVKADATHHIDLKNLPDEKLDQLIHILESDAGDAAPAGYALGCSPNGKDHTLEEPDQ